MRYLLIYFSILFFFSSGIKAQLIDSLKSSLQKKPGLDFNIETRNSFLLNDTVKFRGVKLGVSLGKKFRVGVTTNWLSSRVYNSVKYFYDNSKDTSRGYFKMAYIGIYTEFVYHKTKRWQFSTPLQLSYGESWFQDSPRLKLRNKKNSQSMIIYEPTVAVQFKLLKWVGIAGNIGYRFVYHNDKKIISHLNGPIYTLNLNFMLDQLFFEIFPESEITKTYGPAEW